MAYEQERIDNTIKFARSIAAAMNQFQVSANSLRDLWNAEAYGPGAANEITQEDIDAGAYAGTPVERLNGFMTQVFSFCEIFYVSNVKGEVDKFREVG